MKREIVLDTETTGLSAENGDKIVAVGAVELMDGKQTGKTFYAEIDPLRSVPEEVARIHGLTDEKLKDKPTFPQIAPSFLDFIGDSPLVVHNAPFDMAFLNAELTAAGFAPIAEDRIVDTLPIAKRLYPEERVSLDALCKKFEICQGRPVFKNGKPRAGKGRKRTAAQEQPFRGALFDAQLLAKVYVRLRGKEFGKVLETGSFDDIKRRYEDEAHIYTSLTTALTASAWFGRSDVCRWLVDKEGADVNAKNKHGQTPLMSAAQNGKIDVCKWLVDEAGADVNAVDTWKRTVLANAVKGGHLDVCKWLIDEKGAEAGGKNILMEAAWFGHVDLCRWLVEEKGADVNAKEEDNGETVLIHAAMGGYSDIVTFLVGAGADVNQRTKDGYTVLMAAAMSGNIDMVRFLTEHGADVNANACYGTTAYILATDGNYPDVARFLAEHGADVNAEDAYDETAATKPLTFFEMAKTLFRMENGCLSQYEIKEKS